MLAFMRCSVAEAEGKAVGYGFLGFGLCEDDISSPCEWEAFVI